MQDAYQAMDEADNVVIASPIYFGNLTGSLLHWASRLQFFWAARNIRKVQPISAKHRKGVVILIVNGGEKPYGAAIFAGKDLLKQTAAECCEIVHWTNDDGANEPSPAQLNMEKIVKLAETLNTR